MTKLKRPDDPIGEPEEIDPDVKEVMEEHTRVVSGRGPSVAKAAQKKRALVKAAMRAIQTRDDRTLS
jgi:hypothetical protein